MYQLHLDPTVSARLEQVEKLPCGWTPPLPRLSDYNPNTGLHKSLGIDSVQGASQYWVTKDGNYLQGCITGRTTILEWVRARIDSAFRTPVHERRCSRLGSRIFLG